MNSVFAEINLAFERLDLRRIGGIEHVQLREAGDAAESLLEHFGAKTGSAHAEQENVGESSAFASRGGRLQVVVLRDLLSVMSSHPSQSASSVPVHNDAIVLPQAADFSGRAPVVDVGVTWVG